MPTQIERLSYKLSSLSHSQPGSSRLGPDIAQLAASAPLQLNTHLVDLCFYLGVSKLPSRSPERNATRSMSFHSPSKCSLTSTSTGAARLLCSLARGPVCARGPVVAWLSVCVCCSRDASGAVLGLQGEVPFQLLTSRAQPASALVAWCASIADRQNFSS